MKPIRLVLPLLIALSMAGCGARSAPQLQSAPNAPQQQQQPAPSASAVSPAAPTPPTPPVSAKNETIPPSAAAKSEPAPAAQTTTAAPNPVDPPKQAAPAATPAQPLTAAQRGATADKQSAATPAPSAPAAPAAPKAETKSSVQIVSVTSPAARNSTATLKAKVTPGAVASITVRYKSGASKAAGLEAKKADASGNVSWSWRVGGNTTLGTWPITVECSGVSAQTDFEVVH